MDSKTSKACADRLQWAQDERSDARKGLAAEMRKLAECLTRAAEHIDAGTEYETELRMAEQIGNAGGADLGYYVGRMRDLRSEINVLRWLDRKVAANKEEV